MAEKNRLDPETKQMLIDSAERFLRDNYDFHQHYHNILNHQTVDSEQWQQIAELGWLAVPFEEETGGFEGAFGDLTPLIRLFGSYLRLEPFVTSILAGHLIQDLGSQEQKECHLSALMMGEKRYAVALFEPDQRYNLDHGNTTIDLQLDQSVHVSGQKILVNDVAELDFLIVLAWDNNNHANWLIIPIDQSGLEFSLYPGTDDKPMATVNIDIRNLPARYRLNQGDSEQCKNKLWALACGYTCADSMGCINQLVELTAQYLNERKQFGQAIAGFQALQHKFADMYIQQQRAQSMLDLLEEQIDYNGDFDTTQYLISLAHYQLHQAGQIIAETAIQLHGGIGVTEELSIGHFAKRLIANRFRFGDETYHLKHCSQLMLNTAASLE
jgi:alkylation response protein AidB-like acyl-CoA dehydrogenase